MLRMSKHQKRVWRSLDYAQDDNNDHVCFSINIVTLTLHLLKNVIKIQQKKIPTQSIAWEFLLLIILIKRQKLDKLQGSQCEKIAILLA